MEERDVKERAGAECRRCRSSRAGAVRVGLCRACFDRVVREQEASVAIPPTPDRVAEFERLFSKPGDPPPAREAFEDLLPTRPIPGGDLLGSRGLECACRVVVVGVAAYLAMEAAIFAASLLLGGRP